MKPLYLDGGSCVLEIGLEHAALRVVRAGQALQYFPLRRVSRVISSGHAHWSTEAMLACTDKGITITFLNSHGKVRARMIGGVGVRSGLPQRLTDFLHRPDWLTHYRIWYHALELTAVNGVLQRQGLEDDSLRHPSRLKRFLHRQARARLSDVAIKRSDARLYGLLHADITAMLTAAGIDNRFEPAQAQCPDIAADMAHVVIWSLRQAFFAPYSANPERAGHRRPIEAIARDRIVAFYQSQARAVESLVAGMILNLFRRLLELEGRTDAGS